MRTAFITGATGFMGSHFVLNAYGQAYDQFIVMIRGDDPLKRASKLKSALITASESYSTPFNVEEIYSRCHIIFQLCKS